MDINRQLQELLTNLGLPNRFTFSEFLKQIRFSLSKDIIFVPWQFPADITGTCLQSERSIYVFYAEGTIPVYQTLIKIHELIHVLLGYYDVYKAQEEEAALIETILQANMSYDSDVNTLVMRRISKLEAELDVDALAMALMERLLPERLGPDKSLARLDLD